MYIKPIEIVDIATGGITTMSLRFRWLSGEGVLPILARRGAWRHPAPGSQPPQTITPFAPTAVREPVAAS
jgi:hypothetical protein